MVNLHITLHTESCILIHSSVLWSYFSPCEVLQSRDLVWGDLPHINSNHTLVTTNTTHSNLGCYVNYHHADMRIS